MRRDRESRRLKNDDTSVKNILYLLGTILGISIIAFIITFISYGNNAEPIDTERIADIVSNTSVEDNLEQASFEIGKTVEEVKEEALIVEEQINTVNVFDDEVANEETTKKNVEKPQTIETSVVTTQEEVKELEFMMPVEGNISKEFAKDNLVYSETLKEWITHFGIDVEAEKTTVVKAAEEGEITAIKTDPRYGITVTIKHRDGFETRYANLLTSEYVKEGEQVTKGQTIGTVGNTAVFEISDNTHLHFEMIKDGEYVNPTQYIK